MSALTGTLRELATVPDAKMEAPWSWPGHAEGSPLQVRDAFYRCLEDEQHAVATAPPPQGEAARLMALAQTAFGDLRGLLAGLPPALLDRPPPPTGWTLRQTLEHTLVVERRYRAHVEYAAKRSDADPVRLDLEVELAAGERAGGPAEWIERIAAERTISNQLASLDQDALKRPTVWAGYDVDVRFRLHRFAAHLVEHTVQCEKVLAALGSPSSEPARIVRRISTVRGAHELFSAPGTLARLDAAQSELVTRLGR